VGTVFAFSAESGLADPFKRAVVTDALGGIALALEGVVDRLDDLTQRFEEPCAGPVGLALAGGARSVGRKQPS
jgi:hypothetical protein